MSTSRLQLATKIHFHLLRELGHGIDVEQMLHSELYARDVLLVCEACRGTSLADLATQFRRTLPPPAASGLAGGSGRAARPLDWARDTSGFGLSRPPMSEPEQAGRPKATASGRRAWWRWS